MEAELDTTMDAMRDHNRFQGDDRLYVKFFNSPVEDRAKSLVEGRPIFRDAEFVQIMVPGDKSNIVVREVRDTDRRRFPKQYAAFQNNEKEIVEGTPLEQWGYLKASQREELKYFGIRTVEQLANVSDSNAQKFMGINKLRSKAQEYIDAALEGAPAAKLQAELEERDNEIASQKEIIADLVSRIEALEE